jgi:hypothetical protein
MRSDGSVFPFSFVPGLVPGIHGNRRGMCRESIGIGGSFAAPPLPRHRAYGSVHGGSVAASRGGRCQSGKTAGGEEGVGQSGLEGGVPTEPPRAVPARCRRGGGERPADRVLAQRGVASPTRAPLHPGQQREERDSTPRSAQVPRLQLHRRSRTAASDRAAGAGPVHEPGTGPDATHGWGEPGASHRPAVDLSDGLARLFRVLPDVRAPAQFAGMGATAIALPCLVYCRGL